jgi:hypothetical protein
MFGDYDNTEKKFEIIFHNKKNLECTTQELYEFLIWNATNIDDDFSVVLKKLEAGFAVVGDDTEFDFGLGGIYRKGPLTITRIYKPSQTPPPIPMEAGVCRHERKYINQAGGTKFWVCPTCKKDLGNA